MLIESPKPKDNERSPEWPKVRGEYLAEHHSCEGCGAEDSAAKLEVHHVQPFHLHPELELDPTNFITLCEHPSHDCHFHFGHLLDWRAVNPSVREDAAGYLGKVKGRLYG